MGKEQPKQKSHSSDFDKGQIVEGEIVEEKKWKLAITIESKKQFRKIKSNHIAEALQYRPSVDS